MVLLPVLIHPLLIVVLVKLPKKIKQFAKTHSFNLKDIKAIENTGTPRKDFRHPAIKQIDLQAYGFIKNGIELR